ERVLGIFTGSTEMEDDEVQTINNDYFSGKLLLDSIEFRAAAGHNLEFKKDEIRAVKLDNGGKTEEIDTTLFFMANGDKFSGRLLNTNLTVKTEYAEKNIRADAFSRIGFFGSGQMAATVTLNNGSQFKGDVLEARFRIQPDSMHEISICVDKLASVQFNVRKLIAGQFSDPASIFDSDGDGIPDARDECPDTGCGFVTDNTGCRPLSDTDGDGVDDTKDLCSGTPAGVHADPNGCWVIRAAMFGHNKSAINPDYYTPLDEIAAILEQNPKLQIEVQGHADNVGSAEYNLQLTQSRAKAVVNYFISKGVERNRLTAVGYGFSQPKAGNDTAEGRALNRRVELVPVHE
ncbi:MAG: OmpA family protein, partial [Deltaproteobacteria bacterium]|nr:OmpA family protein [Deltaproteobacteria bacterium]